MTPFVARLVDNATPYREGSNAALAWANADLRTNRTDILKALRIDPSDRTALFASMPFRVVADQGERFIGAAIGCPPHLDADAMRAWSPNDIRDVLLWSPKRGTVRVMGEAQPVLVLPDDRGTVTLFADPFAFMRAWVERRAAAMVRKLHVTRWQTHTREPGDSYLPGALAIGDLARMHLGTADVEAFVPGPGVAPDALRQAVYRSARMPRVIAAPALRKSA